MTTRTLRRTVLILACAAGVIAIASSGAAAQASPQAPAAGADLRARGPLRTYEGPASREVAMPIGGIGTGTISVGGRGNLRDWEIFNRPGKGVDMPFSFFTIWFQSEGQKPVLRVLEGPIQPPFYTHGSGYRRGEVPGFPRMETSIFHAEYPFARVELRDRELPLEIEMEAFNPFVPLEPEDSGLPGMILRYKVKNLSGRPARITVAGSLPNPVGYDAVGYVRDVEDSRFGKNVNQLRKGGPLQGLFMSSQKVAPASPAFGTLALTTPWRDITYLSHWGRQGWFDDLQMFADDLAADGRLKDVDDASPSPDNRTDVGSLGLVATLAPGEEAVFPFVLAWHFPNLLNYFDNVPSQQGKIYKNHFADRFPDAWAAAEALAAGAAPLEAESRKFQKAFFDSTLPPYVLDAVSTQAAIIRTPSCIWLSGSPEPQFFGFEGCGDQEGCCPLDCTHVWNYAQSLAFLFPALERSMIKVDFLTNVRPAGNMVFRTALPVGGGVFWDFKPAADGQMGRIINLYRDWQVTGDTAFLRQVWPQAKKALEYAWTSWDADRDGLLEGEQHNTYDIEFYGPNSMLSGFYLGALQAGARMADALGDRAAAKAYRAVYDKGRANYDATLWNGEYYVQKYAQVMEKKYQYGDGCLSDQMLGQELASIAGLDRFLPADRLKATLGSIYRYNFRKDFRDFVNAQRTYAMDGEQGLLLCSWPKGGRPPLPFPYSDEVWTGIEYQVASHLILEGLVDEGLTVVKAVRDRYDGRRRNPFDELECGHHYVRAMSSWGVLLALSGFRYSGPDMTMGFDPRIDPADFRSFWSTGSGWGSYAQRFDGAAGTVALEVASGEVALKEFSFARPGVPAKSVSAAASVGGTPVKTSVAVAGGTVRLAWARPVVVKAGQALTIAVK